MERGRVKNFRPQITIRNILITWTTTPKADNNYRISNAPYLSGHCNAHGHPCARGHSSLRCLERSGQGRGSGLPLLTKTRCKDINKNKSENYSLKVLKKYFDPVFAPFGYQRENYDSFRKKQGSLF
jgi:hypothetical protein